ncbi:hypothetical protein [Burkholderia multivorans]|uniref:Uncharacterized protein n=1 Tax=Burkholderia multivorans CGD2 TaxID=513052 RepID=B9BIT4_9BURK|nr:hypothetical protein [Burkholderia multivorans]EEE09617.1 hypothetical protein BURMUCGD2_4990 [Burkholderia multivorans CGD2]EEE15540.1 hypothetical protein BURMUCGD2M_4983 [Burkholderia multivorans CGD2M]MBU9147928.1 hypothetical protein [Burkholderia multivorans]MBU9409790.1 hypothetical protein [Burkholderia multivorans]MBU9481663.1 hypothetical protein [Burkholderia multivorans]
MFEHAHPACGVPDEPAAYGRPSLFFPCAASKFDTGADRAGGGALSRCHALDPAARGGLDLFTGLIGGRLGPAGRARPSSPWLSFNLDAALACRKRNAHDPRSRHGRRVPRIIYGTGSISIETDAIDCSENRNN